jgi:hypothetical protein
VDCRVKDHKFEGRGGPENLHDILQVFLDWVKAP